MNLTLRLRVVTTLSATLEFYDFTLLIFLANAISLNFFPAEARYSGVAFCHNLAFCIFGGATPMLLEWLCKHGWLLSPGLWPAVVCFVLMILSFQWKDRYQEKLSDI